LPPRTIGSLAGAHLGCLAFYGRTAPVLGPAPLDMDVTLAE
jgi:hypothetical protein